MQHKIRATGLISARFGAHHGPSSIESALTEDVVVLDLNERQRIEKNVASN